MWAYLYRYQSKSWIRGVDLCDCGFFILPDGYKPANPAYLIQPITKGKLQNNVIVYIQHYVSLENKEDCEDMAFLVAGTTPKYRESNPVYAFRKIEKMVPSMWETDLEHLLSSLWLGGSILSDVERTKGI